METTNQWTSRIPNVDGWYFFYGRTNFSMERKLSLVGICYGKVKTFNQLVQTIDPNGGDMIDGQWLFFKNI